MGHVGTMGNEAGGQPISALQYLSLDVDEKTCTFHLYFNLC